jgi:hypothetical protein
MERPQPAPEGFEIGPSEEVRACLSIAIIVAILDGNDALAH